MRQPRAALMVAMTAALPLVTGSCKPVADQLTGTLTPARSLAGTWSTAIAVPMNLQSDICTGVRLTVAKQNWTVTWIITEQAGTSNGIDVEMHIPQRSTGIPVAGCPDGTRTYVNEPSPMFLSGTISGARVQLRNQASGASYDGNLIDRNLTGTFGVWDCLIYCTGAQSDPLTFILTKKE